jgi:CHAT domain-containing protein
VDADPLERQLRGQLHSNQQHWGDGHPATAMSTLQLAYYLKDLRKYDEARVLVEQSLKAIRHVAGELHEITVRLEQVLGELHFLMDDYERADSMLEMAAQGTEHLRVVRGALGLDSVAPQGFNLNLPLHAITLVKRQQDSEAWQQFEQAKARGLLDDFAMRRMCAHDTSGIDEQIVHEDNVRVRDAILARAGSTQSDSLSPMQLVSELLDQQQRELAWFIDRKQVQIKQHGVEAGKVYDLQQVQSQIPVDAALITWAGVWWNREGKGEFWACVARHAGDPQWVRLPGNGTNGSLSAEQLELGNRVTNSVVRRPSELGQEWDDTEVKQLASDRFAPLERILAVGDLPPVKKLVVVFPGPSQMPIEAFVNDKYTVSYAPSATIFAWLRGRARSQQRTSPRRLLAVGDPIDGGSDSQPAGNDSIHPTQLAQRAAALRSTFHARTTPLPYSGKEIDAIHRLFDDSLVLVKELANETEVQKLARQNQLRSFRFIHFATHGEPNLLEPFGSALILSRSATPAEPEWTTGWVDDGRLTGQQIIDTWNLDADLVVLSACDTAIGPHVHGEHYVGFSQALLLAGADSVILSLWPVEDGATSLLMTRFYENVLGKREGLEQPLSKAEALQEAKQWLRSLPVDQVNALLDQPTVQRGTIVHRKPIKIESARPFAHPYYWAPFILIGDPGY